LDQEQIYDSCKRYNENDSVKMLNSLIKISVELWREDCIINSWHCIAVYIY
jgi:hypothetical protein